MPVREFSDTTGRNWRAWEILPEAIHPRVKAEDYLADCYEIGWVVFETTDGREKRRLCPFPKSWHSAADAELLKMLERAEVVPPSRFTEADLEGTSARPDSAAARGPHAGAHSPTDITDLTVVRAFRYPGGRLWSVSVVQRPESGGAPVLRFTAGARSIDLRHWPRDWADYPDQRLVELLRLAAPRATDAPPPFGTPPRRYTDLRTH